MAIGRQQHKYCCDKFKETRSLWILGNMMEYAWAAWIWTCCQVLWIQLYVLELRTANCQFSASCLHEGYNLTWKSASSPSTSDIRIFEESKSKFQRLQSHVSILKLQSAECQHESPHGMVKTTIAGWLYTSCLRVIYPPCLMVIVIPTIIPPSTHPVKRSPLPAAACEARRSRRRSADLLLRLVPAARPRLEDQRNFLRRPHDKQTFTLQKL